MDDLDYTQQEAGAVMLDLLTTRMMNEPGHIAWVGIMFDNGVGYAAGRERPMPGWTLVHNEDN